MNDKEYIMFDSFILGIIQGITEFLPVSSSAHLRIAEYFMKFDVADNVSFEISLHAATLLAVCIVFFGDIKNVVIGFFEGLKDIKTSWKENENFRMAIMIIIATIPAAVFGIFIRDYLNNIPFSRIGTNMFIMGIILFLTHKYDKNDSEKKSAKDMEIWIAVAIGLAQASAIFPGISRSGMTIAIALFLGMKRNFAGVFSFLLSIPVILGATLLELKSISSFEPEIMLAGLVGAFVSGFIALKFLMSFLKKGKLYYFGFYMMIIGSAVFMYFMVR